MIQLDLIREEEYVEMEIEKYFSDSNDSESLCFAKGFMWGLLAPLPLVFAWMALRMVL
jgi:hypothetical protein